MSADGLSPRTVRWTHSVLKMTLDHAVDEGHLLGKNPAARTKFPPMRETTHIYLTAGEVAALAHACGDQGDVVSILAYTGLRFGELTGLNVEDVELDARRIRVRRSITQVGGKLVEGNPKSKAGRRSVPIPQRLVPILKGRIDGRAPGAPAVASLRGSRRRQNPDERRRLRSGLYKPLLDSQVPAKSCTEIIDNVMNVLEKV